MDQRLRTHLDQYQGVISARAAGRLGLGPNELRDLVARGLLVRVARGAYVDGALLAAADPLEAHRIRTVAIVLSRHGSVAASHESAALVHGLPVLRADLGPVRVVHTSKSATPGGTTRSRCTVVPGRTRSASTASCARSSRRSPSSAQG